MGLLDAADWISQYCEQPNGGCKGCRQLGLNRTCLSWVEYKYHGIIPTPPNVSINRNTKWMRVFKIKRITDGKFKDKGMNTQFSDKGNTWATKGLVRAHITMNDCYKDLYKDCVIVEYQLEEVGMEKIE